MTVGEKSRHLLNVKRVTIEELSLERVSAQTAVVKHQPVCQRDLTGL